MILLNPNDSLSVIKLILRDPTPTGNVTVTIEEEGRGLSESFTVAPGTGDDNFITLEVPFTILEEDTLYTITIISAYTLPSDWIGPVISGSPDYTVLYRGRAFSTSTSSSPHTINTNVFTEDTNNDNEQYTIHH